MMIRSSPIRPPRSSSSSSTRLTLRLGLYIFGGTLIVLALANLYNFYGATTQDDVSSLLHIKSGEEEEKGDGGASSTGWGFRFDERHFNKLREVVSPLVQKVKETGGEEGGNHLRTEKPIFAKEEEEKQKTETSSSSSAAAASSTKPVIIGSQVDLEEALRKTKEKIRAEEEERKRIETSSAEYNLHHLLQEEKKKAVVPVKLVDKHDDENDQPSNESGIIRPIMPAGDKAQRLPITSRPPLHRRRNETHIQKILVTLSSIDRGARIADVWQGDKLETILIIMSSLKALCERGFDVTVWFVMAWKISLESRQLEEALFCERIQKPIAIRYWDDFDQDIEGLLSSKHRLAVKQVADDYDFFISIEDDIHLTPLMFDAYVDASNRLALASQGEDLLPGFSRKEHDKRKGNEWALWETTQEDYQLQNYPNAGYFANVWGNPHQALWMATREQLYHFDDRCVDGFFNVKSYEGADWVEYWSGALQLWDGEYCQGLRKVIPISNFRNFTVWHMTDSKLYLRGTGVQSVEGLVGELERQRCLYMGCVR